MHCTMVVKTKKINSIFISALFPLSVWLIFTKAAQCMRSCTVYIHSHSSLNRYRRMTWCQVRLSNKEIKATSTHFNTHSIPQHHPTDKNTLFLFSKAVNWLTWVEFIILICHWEEPLNEDSTVLFYWGRWEHWLDITERAFTSQYWPLQVSIVFFFTSSVQFLRENAKHCMFLSPVIVVLYVHSLKGENDLFA